MEIKRLEMQSDMKKFYALFPEPALAEDLINILEDYRINSMCVRLSMYGPQNQKKRYTKSILGTQINAEEIKSV